MTAPSENDLPLMANTADALVHHYILDLTCDVEQKVFSGSLTLFLDISLNGENKQVFSIQEYQNIKKTKIDTSNKGPGHHTSETFSLVLDCCDITVDSVEKICTPKEDLNHLFEQTLDESASRFRKISLTRGTSITYTTDKWSLRISDPDNASIISFCPVIRINYRTTPGGSSLRWVLDQDSNICVYTAGMWINNRSFMPCQEYGSLSTWQAFIKALPPLRVFMSGDEVEQCTTLSDGYVDHYFKSVMPLPSFTVAIAVGKWRSIDVYTETNHIERRQDCTCAEQPPTPECFKDERCSPSADIRLQEQKQCPIHPEYLEKTCSHVFPCAIPFSSSPTIPCRIIAPVSIIEQASVEFKSTFPKYCQAVQKTLGPCPFNRMDIVVYPPSSQDMAMCNPSLLFVSQSSLTTDHSMSIRLGHELSHYWFGLLIGAKDWTEEWLSEGFATFVEDLVHADAMGWNEEEAALRNDLAAYLRYKTLHAELDHTSSDLQSLRPNQDKGLEASVDGHDSVMFIKNGINPNKLFTQVHYLKGYFLLRWLENQIGRQQFKSSLRDYVSRHHGQMVTSRDFLNLAFEKFSSLSDQGYSVSSVCQEWLDSPGLPRKLEPFTPIEQNVLFKVVLEELEKWNKLDRCNKRMRSAAKRPKTIDSDHFCELDSQQLLILLDKLLERRSLCNATLTKLNRQYTLNLKNPEIQHRWFELVVKYRRSTSYKDLHAFLINHRAMGVYLYGEMVIARCPRLRKIAEDCFNATNSDMEPTTKRMVHQMIYGW